MTATHAHTLEGTKVAGRARRWAVATLITVAAAGVGAMAWAGGERSGPGHHGHAGGAMAMGPGLFGGSPERVERGVDRLLEGLQATDAQRAQIQQIARSAATDLKAQHAAGRGLFERQLQVLTAPVIDAAAAEQVRQQMLAHHDQMSQRMLQAMVQISQALTPEQRATLAQRMKDRHRHGGPAHDTSPPAR